MVAAPAAPAEVAPPAPAYNSRIAADAHAGAGTAAGDAGGNAAGGDGMLGPGIPADGAEAVGGGGDPTAEAFPTGGEGTRKGLGLQWGAGNGMAGERESIPRDGSTLDVSWVGDGGGVCQCGVGSVDSVLGVNVDVLLVAFLCDQAGVGEVVGGGGGVVIGVAAVCWC